MATKGVERKPRSCTKDAVRPVTIAQIARAEKDEYDGETRTWTYKIDGVGSTYKVMVVATVISERYGTSSSGFSWAQYKLSDGTSTIQAADLHSTSGPFMPQNKGSLPQLVDVCAGGRIVTEVGLTGVPHNVLHIDWIRPVTDPHETLYHFLNVIATGIIYERGPPPVTLQQSVPDEIRVPEAQPTTEHHEDPGNLTFQDPEETSKIDPPDSGPSDTHVPESPPAAPLPDNQEDGNQVQEDHIPPEPRTPANRKTKKARVVEAETPETPTGHDVPETPGSHHPGPPDTPETGTSISAGIVARRRQYEREETPTPGPSAARKKKKKKAKQTEAGEEGTPDNEEEQAERKKQRRLSGRDPYSHLPALQRAILLQIFECKTLTGVHVQLIARNMNVKYGADPETVSDALDALLDENLIETADEQGLCYRYKDVKGKKAAYKYTGEP